MTIPLLETGNNPHGLVIQELPPSHRINMPKGRPEKGVAEPLRPIGTGKQGEY
jgi:hypothetical protein